MNLPTPPGNLTATRNRSRRRWLWVAGAIGAAIAFGYGGLDLVDMSGMLDAPATYDLASIDGQQLPAYDILGGQMILRSDHSWSVELNRGAADGYAFLKDDGTYTQNGNAFEFSGAAHFGGQGSGFGHALTIQAELSGFGPTFVFSR
jgi:hypothetical protein